MSLKATNLTFKYHQNSPENVIQNLTIDIPNGKTTLLVGKSGCGKSTLAYLLAGLYPENGGFVSSGVVTCDGVNINELTPGIPSAMASNHSRAHGEAVAYQLPTKSKILRQQCKSRVSYVSMMFQNPDLQFCMQTLKQELYFCLENIGVPEREFETTAKKTAGALGIGQLLDRNFNTMSGGEKQKCALACIFALGSKYVILDEAFANIDTKSAREIIQLIQNMDVTVLAIEHHIELWDGAYDEIVSLDGLKPKIFDTKPLIHEPGEVILEMAALDVNGIKYPDMTFRKGGIYAIVGASGSGKTTLFKTLIRQNKYVGKIKLGGRELKKIRKRVLYSKCGIVFQNPANQFLSLTVYDEILFSINRWYKKQSADWKADKVTELLALFKLEKHKNYSPYMLSQGQQRRLAVLAMIAGAQEVLLLDEPTYGQDYENMKIMMELLLEKAKSGLTIIFSTHNEHIAKNFSHQMIELDVKNVS